MWQVSRFSITTKGHTIDEELMQTTAVKTEPARLPVRMTALVAATLTVAAAVLGFALNRVLWPQVITMPSAAAQIGDQVSDGRLAFTVTSVRRGVDTVGDRYFGATADHKFTIVDLHVVNHAETSQTFDASYIEAFDNSGERIVADREAGYYANDVSDGGLLQPGDSAHVVLVFDTTRSKQPTLLQVHDSAFSGGEPISLRG